MWLPCWMKCWFALSQAVRSLLRARGFVWRSFLNLAGTPWRSGLPCGYQSLSRQVRVSAVARTSRASLRRCEDWDIEGSAPSQRWVRCVALQILVQSIASAAAVGSLIIEECWVQQCVSVFCCLACESFEVRWNVMTASVKFAPSTLRLSPSLQTRPWS